MVIFFYGEDSFRSKEKLREIREKFLGSGQVGSGLSIFDFSEKVEGNLISSFSSQGLFSEKRLVIIKNIIGSGSKEIQTEVLEYLKKTEGIFSDRDLVVVFWEENNPRKNNALFVFLEKSAKKQKFDNLSGFQLEKWIEERISSFDSEKKISKEALLRLVAYTGGNMYFLDNEIRKLLDFSLSPQIEKQDVELMVRATLGNDIFETIEAVGKGNKKESLLMLQNHLEKGDEPFYLFSMLVYQFRNLMKIAALHRIGKNNEYEIAKLAKLHPFVVKKSMGQIRSLPFEKLKEIYLVLGKIDFETKTGKADIRLALQKFLVEL